MGAIVRRTRFDEGTESAEVATSVKEVVTRTKDNSDHFLRHLGPPYGQLGPLFSVKSDHFLGQL